ncbi:MAG: hypothetical protein L3K09_01965 [Thermoplasmata archaeon]|nr:hypothetical protein [Thermoplasmata archaeon]
MDGGGDPLADAFGELYDRLTDDEVEPKVPQDELAELNEVDLILRAHVSEIPADQHAVVAELRLRLDRDAISPAHRGVAARVVERFG